MALKNTTVKRGLYKNSLHPNNIEMYVIEDKKDLNAFFKAFPTLAKFKQMADAYTKSVNEGKIIIANDPHPTHGLNTYCFESPDTPDPHPSAYIRIKLID